MLNTKEIRENPIFNLINKRISKQFYFEIKSSCFWGQQKFK